MFKRIIRKIITNTYWKLRLGSIGWKSIIYKPILITNPDKIYIGKNTLIRDNARLEVINRPDMGWSPRLEIGNNVNIEQGAHIICQAEVIIESDVSITPYCVLVDTYHPYHNPTIGKIGNGLPIEKTFLRIGRGSFIGTHSVIMPNVSIGKYCIIGAGSVVTKSITDYSIAMGNPAKVTAKYNIDKNIWEKI